MSTYRDHAPGSPEHYLLVEYPLGLDYEVRVDSRPVPAQLHVTARDQGTYLGTGVQTREGRQRGDGSLAWTSQFSGYLGEREGRQSWVEHSPRQWWTDALDELQTAPGDGRYTGRELVRALAWYQDAGGNRLRGYRAVDCAKRLGCDEMGLARRRDAAMRYVCGVVQRRAVAQRETIPER